MLPLEDWSQSYNRGHQARQTEDSEQRFERMLMDELAAFHRLLVEHWP